MHVTVKWFDGEYPSFNVNIASAEGKEEFLSIKSCKIMSGSNGEFLSMPSTKNQKTGKYWNHAWASEAFANHVLSIAQAIRPQQQQRSAPETTKITDQDIPF